MWELNYKESWAKNNWCFWTVVLEKTLESPLDCEEIQPVHPKGDQSWVFIGRTDVEAETPILWPPDSKIWLIWKEPDAGKDWGQEEKGTTEDEMFGWHHWLNAYGFGWTPRVDDGQGGLACCGSWGSQRVKHDWATELNWGAEHTHPCTHMRQINRKKLKQKFKYMGKTQENWVICQNRQSPHLKYHLQLKVKKKDVGCSVWDFKEEEENLQGDGRANVC